MKTTAKLRQLLKSESLIVAPFVLNAFHAKIAESVGLPAVYMTGAGTSAERGFPDVGLLTMTEMVANAKYIAGAVDIPVICDADTGYGNPLNVQSNVNVNVHFLGSSNANYYEESNAQWVGIRGLADKMAITR